ncbi:MAG: hypothetical protein J1F06_00985 [Prevotellaceae bacterium]|nr:hypothetical protein [Prevotellaceae bacterium]
MTTVRKHNPALQQRLALLVEAGETDRLADTLDSLSHADRRTASYLLAEKLLPAMTEASRFWTLFKSLVSRNARAYLGTMLKAAAALYDAGRIELALPPLDYTDVDARKIADAFLPVLRTPAEIASLHPSKIALVRGGTVPCYYVLFQELKQLDGKPQIQTRFCLELIRRGDSLSFNMAALVQAYFGLPPVNATFSLRVEPFQLSRLDETYESFAKTLTYI